MVTEIPHPASSNDIGLSVLDRYKSAMRIPSWNVQPSQPGGRNCAPLTLATSSVNGLTASRVSLMSHLSENRPGRDAPSHRYVAFSCDRAHYLQMNGGAKIKVAPHEIFIIDPRQSFIDCYPTSYICCSLVFDADLFEDMVPGAARLAGRGLGRGDQISGLLEGTMQCIVDNVVDGRFDETAPALAQAFLAMLRLKARQEPTYVRHAWSQSERCMQIKHHIDSNFHCPDFSILAMARQLGLSTRYIAKVFSFDGKGPAEYLRQVRLETAARMLSGESERRQTVTDVAYACGFNESAHFSREFKRHFGVAPREFKAQSSCRETA